MNQQAYTVHYANFNSVLVINPVGKLRQLYTPFRVYNRNAKGQKRRWYLVEEVFASTEDKLFYLIGTNLYPHSEFTIEIQF